MTSNIKCVKCANEKYGNRNMCASCLLDNIYENSPCVLIQNNLYESHVDLCKGQIEKIKEEKNTECVPKLQDCARCGAKSATRLCKQCVVKPKTRFSIVQTVHKQQCSKCPGLYLLTIQGDCINCHK